MMITIKLHFQKVCLGSHCHIVDAQIRNYSIVQYCSCNSHAIHQKIVDGHIYGELVGDVCLKSHDADPAAGCLRNC